MCDSVAANASRIALRIWSGASTFAADNVPVEVVDVAVTCASPFAAPADIGALGSRNERLSLAIAASLVRGHSASARTGGGGWPHNGVAPAVQSNAFRPATAGPGYSSDVRAREPSDVKPPSTSGTSNVRKAPGPTGRGFGCLKLIMLSPDAEAIDWNSSGRSGASSPCATTPTSGTIRKGIAATAIRRATFRSLLLIQEMFHRCHADSCRNGTIP